MANYCELVSALDGARELQAQSWKDPSPVQLGMYTLSLCAALQQLAGILVELSHSDRRVDPRRYQRSLLAMEAQRDRLWAAHDNHEASAVLQRGERLLRTMDAAVAMLRTRTLVETKPRRDQLRVPPPPRCSRSPRLLPAPARNHPWDVPTQAPPPL